MIKTHDLTHGWKLTEFDNGSLAIMCDDTAVGGIALDAEQAKRLREIVLNADVAELADTTNYAIRAAAKRAG